MNAGHSQSFFGSGAAAIFFRAVHVHAGTTTDAHSLGDGLVTRNFLGNGDIQPIFAALRATLDQNLFGDGIAAPSFHLIGFGAVAIGVAMFTEHRTTGGKAKGSASKGNKHEQIFHGAINWWLGLKRRWLDYMQQQEARAKTTATTAVMVTKSFMAGGMVESLRDLAMKKTGEMEFQAQRCKLERGGRFWGQPSAANQ